MKRRQFLLDNLAVLTAGLLPGVASALTSSSDPGGLPLLASAMTLENFAAYQGERFMVYGGEGAREVEILQLVDVQDKGSDDIIEQFWLHFETGAGSTLEKNVYTFDHPHSGKFQLWVEPGETIGNKRSIWVRFSMLKNFDPAMAPMGSFNDSIA